MLPSTSCEPANGPERALPVTLQVRFFSDEATRQFSPSGHASRAPTVSFASASPLGALAAAERDEVARIFVDISLAESGDPFFVNFELTQVAPEQWSGEVPLLPRHQQLRFAARAFDGGGAQVFSGEAFASLTVTGQSVEIPLAPAQDGETLPMPRLSRILYPAEIFAGHEEQVAFTVQGNAGAAIQWKITASGSSTPAAAFSPASGTMILGGAVATFMTVYAAPPVQADTLLDYQVTITAQGTHGAVAITTNFRALVRPRPPGAVGTRPVVSFNPIILGLTANGSEATGAIDLVAEVTDDGAQTALTYQWGYQPDPETASATFADDGRVNPAVLHGYTIQHAGVITLAVTDERGGTTTLHYTLIPGQFADAVDHVSIGGIKRIAAGAAHTCVLTGEERVRCWGDNQYGQLGYNRTTDVGDAPDRLPHTAGDVPLPADDPPLQLAAGAHHTCVLFTSGMIYCWGRNHAGQLGYNRTDNLGDDEPVTAWGYVTLGALATKIAAGGNHTCALLHGGAVRCWGDNSLGQLGRSHTRNLGDDEPVYGAGDLALGAGIVVKDLALGAGHTCALFTTGAARCWGDNDYGQLGYGHTLRLGDNEHASAVPDLSMNPAVRKLMAGGHHTCALSFAGSLRCWGRGELGQLGQSRGGGSHWGDAPGELPSALPGDIFTGATITDAAAGGNHTCALLSDNRLKCWGAGGSGQLGYGALGNLATPPTSGVSLGDVAPYRVATGAEHTCAQRKDGRVRCWGRGGDGRLGRGSTTHSASATSNVHIFPPGPSDLPPSFFYGYTGAVQTLVVPAAARHVEIKAWGAGGGGAVSAEGGGGGYGRVTNLAVMPGQTLSIVVGQGGRHGANSGAFGGGGFRRPGGPTGCGGTYFDPPISGGGGGYSGVFLGTVARANALLVAGGGGGGGAFGGIGGAGGGATGGVSNISSGAGGGGTQLAGGTAGLGVSSGTAGAALQGGNSDCAGQGGGGGGGYFGGGGSAAINGGDPGGGGGSGYAPGGTTVAGTGRAPGMASDPDYVVGVGAGGLADGHGGHGYVVITFL